MGRTTRNSRKLSKQSRSILKASRKGALDDICVKMHKATVNNNGRLPYAYITRLLNDLKSSPGFNWLTRNIINKAFLKFKENVESKKQKGKGNDESTNMIGMDVDMLTVEDSAVLSELSGDAPGLEPAESASASVR